LDYAGREASASPATGYMSLHIQQQQKLVRAALGLDDEDKRIVASNNS